MRKDRGLWQTIYPIQGEWHRLRDISQIGGIYLKLLELHRATAIEAISTCSGDMRKWVLKTQDRITAFHCYLIRHLGEDDLKIRVRAKHRHHPIRLQ